jgi:hypothetical protein
MGGVITGAHARKPHRAKHNQKQAEGGQMHGTLDIRKAAAGPVDAELYQIRYEDLGGESFTASMNKEDLHELLYDKLSLHLADGELDRAFDRVLHDGHVTFPEIEMREEELAGVGLRYLAPEG